MRPKFRLAGWTLTVLGLISCGHEAPAADAPAVQIEKKSEVVKAGEREAVIHTPAFQGIEDPGVLEALHESIASGVRDSSGSSPEEWKVSGEDWLTEIDYRVTHNRHGLLSLVYVVAGVGAYPDQMEAYVVADLKTGRRLTAKDLFRSQEELAAKVERMRAASVEKAIQENRAHLEDYGMTEENLMAAMEPARQSRFGVENLDTFRLDDKGVTFVYDFGFPHASQALEPSGEYFLSYEELRPYVDPEGPLSRIL